MKKDSIFGVARFALGHLRLAIFAPAIERLTFFGLVFPGWGFAIRIMRLDFCGCEICAATFAPRVLRLDFLRLRLLRRDFCAANFVALKKV